MASATPDLRLPSQPQGITAHWLVPNYRATANVLMGTLNPAHSLTHCGRGWQTCDVRCCQHVARVLCRSHCSQAPEPPSYIVQPSGETAVTGENPPSKGEETAATAEGEKHHECGLELGKLHVEFMPPFLPHNARH